MSGWAFIRGWAILVYLFMFLPVAVVVLLSFNANQFGSFPMTGFSFRWFVALWENEAVMRAFRVSFVLGATDRDHLDDAGRARGPCDGALRLSRQDGDLDAADRADPRARGGAGGGAPACSCNSSTCPRASSCS